MLTCVETRVPFLQSSFEEPSAIHPHPIQIRLLAINPLEWRCCAEPQLKPGLLASQKTRQSCYKAHTVIPSYVITNWMKKHCLWQILSCLGVRERVGRLDLQPALSRAPGSTPCRWAKSRRSPVAKVPVAVGPRSKASQVPLVQLVHGTHFLEKNETKNTKASELKTPLPCIPWRYSWPRGCLARNITWVSKSARCHQDRVGNVTGSFQILHHWKWTSGKHSKHWIQYEWTTH